MAPIGRFFILLGFVLIILGLILAYSDFFSFLRLGRLPGDIHPLLLPQVGRGLLRSWHEGARSGSQFTLA
ncbi:MAG: hypothetical protein DMG09_16115 [Acidobacteria bacterium]|nr:MAG: hypothetical protein DMG09_16115 [Acidobacteriota bacterium]